MSKRKRQPTEETEPEEPCSGDPTPGDEPDPFDPMEMGDAGPLVPRVKPEPANGATKAKAKAYETPCACGCGEFARKAFVSSHDAKLAAAIRSTGRTGKKALSDEQLDAVVARWAFASQNPRVAESPYFQRLVAAAGI